MGGLIDDIGNGLGDLGRGLKNRVDDGLGAIEDGIDSGKKALGETVDWVTDETGKRLDEYGLHKAADVVTDWGDGVASDLGATPGEKQLGQTEDANELVHGDPAKILASAAHLKDFRAAFEKVGQGMRKVDSSRWKGMGGDAFREKFGVHPTKWLHAADACETAAAALEAYAETVRWAQGRASEAIEMYRAGRRASEEAKAAAAAQGATEATVASAQEAGKAAEAAIAEARDRLSHAREQRNAAAAEAEARVDRALAHAPAEPPPLDRLGDNLVDGFQAYNVEMTHVVGGALKGTAGLLNFARGLNPLDAYNLTHPAAYMQNVSMTLSGLVSTSAHPDRVVTAAVEGFKDDPSEFLGRLLPELIGTKGTGLARGGLRLAAREGLETGATNLATKGAKYGDDLAAAAPHPPAPSSWADDAAPHTPPAGPAEEAVSGLPKSWTIDNATAHPGPVGLVDDLPSGSWDDLGQGAHHVDEGATHAQSADPKAGHADGGLPTSPTSPRMNSIPSTSRRNTRPQLPK
ncbi:putative T7SS-secreted protein [Streptomyces sp. SBR177]